MVCEDKIVCENHWIKTNFDINWTFCWHPEPIVPIRIFMAEMMQKGLIIGKIIVEQGNEIAWSERWNARLITRFYNDMLNIGQKYRLLRYKMYLSFLSVSRKQWFLNRFTYGLFQLRKYEHSNTKHDQAFFGFVGSSVHTATLYLNLFENDEYFEETE